MLAGVLVAVFAGDWSALSEPLASGMVLLFGPGDRKFLAGESLASGMVLLFGPGDRKFLAGEDSGVQLSAGMVLLFGPGDRPGECPGEILLGVNCFRFFGPIL